MSTAHRPPPRSSNPHADTSFPSPNWSEAQPLLVILHDAPEVAALVHPVTGQIEPRKTWLVSIPPFSSRGACSPTADVGRQD